MRETGEEGRRRPPRRVVVIGGGISGLAAAHRLAERQARGEAPAELLLLEASARLGGTVETVERDGFLLEGGPDSFISEKPEALELARRVGLAERLIETNPEHRRSFVVRGGRLHPTPEGFQLLAPSRLWPFVTSKIFSWPGKARMALDLVLPRRQQRGQVSVQDAARSPFADESLAAFVRRRFGREALERMAQPMVGGIYTADPEQLSLRATMPRFLEMEREHRSLIWAMWRAARRQRRATENGARRAMSDGTSGARYSLFLSFDRGVQVLTDRLSSLIPEASIRLHSRVEALGFDPSTRQWTISLGEREAPINADAVCLALPAYASARLLRTVDPVLADELDAVPYASTATVNLAFRRDSVPHPLDGFGFVVPFIERRATLACTFSSIKFEGRAPAGHALLRAFVGGALQPEMFALDEEAISDAVRRDLRELLGIEAEPLFTVVRKWPRSMAQYHLGHLDRVARIRERLDRLTNLRLAGNAYGGAGLPDCIRSGHAACDSLFETDATE